MSHFRLTQVNALRQMSLGNVLHMFVSHLFDELKTNSGER